MAVTKSAGMARSARILSTVAKRWYVIVLATGIGAVGAFAMSATVTPTYTSSTSLFFSLNAGDSAADFNQASAYTQNQMFSYAQLAMSSIVLDQVVKDIDSKLDKNALRESIDVSTPQKTVILDINVSTTDPELSALIANSTAQSLKSAVSAISAGEGTGTSDFVANVIEPAVPATVQSSPDKKKNAILGGILGALVSLFAVALSVVLDTKVRSEAALKSMTNLPLLGTVERNRANPDSRPIALRSPNGPATERFRQIRAGLRFAAASHEMTSIAITSATPSEGKTLTSMNLALVMAESKERILLIDADLRRPRIAESIGFEGAIGLTTVLVGDVTLQDAVQSFANTTLDILTAGGIPPNPAQLLGSKPMQDLVEQAKRDYDFVIVDTAPVLAVADVAVIAQVVDSVVLVVDSTKVRQAQLEQVIDALETAGVHISGAILNRVKPSKTHDVYYQERAAGPLHAKHTSSVEVEALTKAGTPGPESAD